MLRAQRGSEEGFARDPFPSQPQTDAVFLRCRIGLQVLCTKLFHFVSSIDRHGQADFKWNDASTWKVDYRKIFEHFRAQLQEATSIFYPDYSLNWILRTDASLHGVGAVLLQVAITANRRSSFNPLGLLPRSSVLKPHGGPRLNKKHTVYISELNTSPTIFIVNHSCSRLIIRT